MPITYRNIKGSPLTINESDGNFEFFTGSYASASHVPGVLVFDSTSTPNTGSNTLFYSSSCKFYTGDFYFGHL